MKTDLLNEALQRAMHLNLHNRNQTAIDLLNSSLRQALYTPVNSPAFVGPNTSSAARHNYAGHAVETLSPYVNTDTKEAHFGIAKEQARNSEEILQQMRNDIDHVLGLLRNAQRGR